jgi:DnaK suppressor protein
MTTKATTEGRAAIRRELELKTMLENRRQELLREVQSKIRHARAGGALERDVLDEGERSELDGRSELGFALIHMATETLDKLDVALGRLREGAYGDCIDCLNPIGEARLRALPFAVRCTTCEDARETAERRERSMVRSGGSMAVFLDRAN